MKKEPIFYSIIALSALISSVSFLFSQYVAYQRFVLADERLLFDQNKAAYDCMKEYYPAIKPDEKGFSVAAMKDSCRQKFIQSEK